MEFAILKEAMARVPGPVVVVTTVDGTERRFGFTASSFVSVSLEPPLILVCLGKGASTHPAFRTAGTFMVNVLAEGQEEVARRFAASGVDRFATSGMTACEMGLPGLSDAVARVACSMHRIVDAGDHSILIGQVESAHVGNRPPLIYADRMFSRVESPALARDVH